MIVLTRNWYGGTRVVDSGVMRPTLHLMSGPPSTRLSSLELRAGTSGSSVSLSPEECVELIRILDTEVPPIWTGVTG